MNTDDEELFDLLRENAHIHAHLDNDLYKLLPHWREQRDQIARELATYYNLILEDGG